MLRWRWRGDEGSGWEGGEGGDGVSEGGMEGLKGSERRVQGWKAVVDEESREDEKEAGGRLRGERVSAGSK